MRMNQFSRLVALLMALCLTLSLLAACGQEQVPPAAETQPPTEAPTEPPTEAPTEPPTEPPTEAPTEPDPDLFVADGNVNPLTGLCDGISDEALNTRPVAVMINNIIYALPQWGISQADIIYEMLAEGRITRFLAIFQDHSKIDKLASIRSARPYYIDIAQSYGAVYIHFGGSVPAYDAIAKRSDLISIDGIKGSWEGTVFFRDPGRKKQMGLEHSVYTTGEYLDLAMEKLTNQGKNLAQSEHPSAFKFGEISDPTSMYLSDMFTISLNIAGNGGMSMPCGLGADTNLPIGVQLQSPQFKDENMFRAAAALEQVYGKAPVAPAFV